MSLLDFAADVNPSGPDTRARSGREGHLPEAQLANLVSGGGSGIGSWLLVMFVAVDSSSSSYKIKQ